MDYFIQRVFIPMNQVTEQTTQDMLFSPLDELTNIFEATVQLRDQELLSFGLVSRLVFTEILELKLLLLIMNTLNLTRKD